MIRILLVILTGIVTSLFLFPFNLTFAANINTKMVLAAFGLLLFFLDMARKRSFIIAKDFFILSLLCIFISLWSFLVITLNNTEDTVFTLYFISVWVWLGGAYAVVWLIRAVHGYLSVDLIGRYLIGVCVAQCILAYLMTVSPSLKSFVDGLMGVSENYMGTAEGRLYGLGAALDPTGLRFSSILVILAYLASKKDFSTNKASTLLNIISFIIIATIGNMIARSTTIGIIISIAYWVILLVTGTKTSMSSGFWTTVSLCMIISVGIIIFLYRTDYSFRNNLRFGFEGFFSIAEKGHWETNSTNILKKMIVWPQSLRTWIIGDGYFSNTLDIPDMFGRARPGYYMQTDIGYLRYIYYFGTIGLLCMVGVFIYIAAACFRVLKNDRILFLLLLLVNLAGWLKVSSDIIMVFAPFLILAFMTENEELENEEAPSD